MSSTVQHLHGGSIIDKQSNRAKSSAYNILEIENYQIMNWKKEELQNHKGVRKLCCICVSGFDHICTVSLSIYAGCLDMALQNPIMNFVVVVKINLCQCYILCMIETIFEEKRNKQYTQNMWSSNRPVDSKKKVALKLNKIHQNGSIIILQNVSLTDGSPVYQAIIKIKIVTFIILTRNISLAEENHYRILICFKVRNNFSINFDHLLLKLCKIGSVYIIRLK
ncbi:unnamed protein product (macronuclear) [Paramecium tetraurelia]|uniref:Uncharacterized protein n=1 Tax=Paramecium tetraurelia TaxID=5888 RepID=A0C3A7_PARTE|nr:uncharacterized protein GSPATT00034753001 [Paramecium tetraurelia]CAK65274.1 unnamed protein product [Paramecium tetraurelia]|eukprot:XP_001432671.1 hypothetical protein (macronuclear) [Paramecium tetraurelia strain d4-2]